MGKDVTTNLEPDEIRTFTRHLLLDLRALERILDEDLIESETRRIGVEQELFLVNQGRRPAPVAMEVLENLHGAAFTTELALFNLEINLEPLVLEGKCLQALARNLVERVGAVRAAAWEHHADIVLTGILPTLTKSDLSLGNITPKPRYYALNDAVCRMRGGPARFRIEGVDELHVEHDSVMLEACNTSFQIHLQVTAQDFARYYNIAQAMIGPVLSGVVNSPLLFGKRLWHETRIALFQQSVDTRAAMPHLRERSPRVRFGEAWVQESVLELFQDDIARFRVLMATEIDEDPIDVLDSGGAPLLKALQLHNSTVYRWNRPCYGLTDGRPHLRIECRALPAGPTIEDEVANAALWIGAVLGGREEYGDITSSLDFDHAKANFLAAARHGLKATFTWTNGETVTASDLLLERLIPLAREGLRTVEIEESSIDHYLGLVQDRIESGRTGAQWILDSASEIRGQGTRAERLAALTGAMISRQAEGRPGHEWSPTRLEEAGGWKENYVRVEQYMTTDLLTVHEDELVDLVAFLMDRNHLRHVIVEDDVHKIVGLVSYRSLLRLLSRQHDEDETRMVPVRDVMVRDPITVTPETSTIEAIELMRRNRVSCLPVVKNGKLIGLVSELDFMPIARQLLEEKLREE